MLFRWTRNQVERSELQQVVNKGRGGEKIQDRDQDATRYLVNAQNKHEEKKKRAWESRRSTIYTEMRLEIVLVVTYQRKSKKDVESDD